MSHDRKQLEDALRFMCVPPSGYEKMLPIAQRGFDELENFVQPRKIWARFPLKINDGKISIGDGSVSCRSKNLAKLFQNCHDCVAMAATLGPEVDRQTQFLGKIDMAHAVAFDACASVLADSLCDEIEREIRSLLTAGEFLTARFSPGYGDLPMEFTGELLKILDAPRRIGLTLSRRGMMIPIKSVTALVGISGRPEKEKRSCDECALVSCQFRRKGGFCHD